MPETLRPKLSPIVIGEIFEVPHPFVREEYQDFEDDKPLVKYRWKPGTRQVDPGDGRLWHEADAVGKQILTVVGVYQPQGFQTRVFYTRRWRDPNGTEFGTKGCRVTALSAFRQLTQGYRYNVEVKGETVEITGGAR